MSREDAEARAERMNGFSREEIRQVPCPECGAQPGQPCHRRRSAKQGMSHQARVDLLRSRWVDDFCDIPEPQQEFRQIARRFWLRGVPPQELSAQLAAESAAWEDPDAIVLRFREKVRANRREDMRP